MRKERNDLLDGLALFMSQYGGHIIKQSLFNDLLDTVKEGVRIMAAKNPRCTPPTVTAHCLVLKDGAHVPSSYDCPEGHVVSATISIIKEGTDTELMRLQMEEVK